MGGKALSCNYLFISKLKGHTATEDYHAFLLRKLGVQFYRQQQYLNSKDTTEKVMKFAMKNLVL